MVPPVETASALVPSNSLARLPASTTECPASCKARATARPIPLPAPVTSAILLFVLILIVLGSNGVGASSGNLQTADDLN
jgi:hypothetical protein